MRRERRGPPISSSTEERASRVSASGKIGLKFKAINHQQHEQCNKSHSGVRIFYQSLNSNKKKLYLAINDKGKENSGKIL